MGALPPDNQKGRNLVILSDGTGQRGGVYFDEARTNIYKLYRAVRCGPDSAIPPERQLAFYDPGLGTESTGLTASRTEPPSEQPTASIGPDVVQSNNRAAVEANDIKGASLPIMNDAAASKIMVESIRALLSASGAENVKFVTYNVDKKELQGFKADMPVLRIIYEERVFFDTDKAEIRSEAQPVAKSIAATLKKQKQKVALFVAGHTDARGSDGYNLKLSIRRAEAVARAIKHEGSGSALIWSVGFGKAIPVRPNNSVQNMALNRRVEFLIASQPDVITAWIKHTKDLCQDEACGPTSVVSNFQAVPISGNGAKPLSIEIPNPKPIEIEMQFHPIEVGPPLQ